MGNYWRKRTEEQVAFAAPAGERWMARVLVAYLLGMALLCFGYGIECVLTHSHASFVLNFLVMGTVFLLLATLPFTSLEANDVAFDLKARTYERTIYGRSLLIRDDVTSSSLGSPLRRKVVCGPMEDIAGIRIYGRVGRGNAGGGKRYAIHIEWADAQPSMVVGIFTQLWDAENQANVIAQMLCLPILEIDNRS